MIRAAVLIAIAMYVSACGRGDIQFDSETWRRTAEDQRHYQVNDLINRKILLGLNAAEVSAILGKPSSVGVEPKRLEYVVRTGGYDFNQVFVLDIRFDSSGRVNVVGVRGD